MNGLSEYDFRGYRIRNMGYYEPEHSVVWEAVDSSGESVARGKTLREVLIALVETDTCERERREVDTLLRSVWELMGQGGIPTLFANSRKYAELMEALNSRFGGE